MKEIIYKADDLIAGRLNYNVDEDNIIINSVIVDPNYRNLGIANKLMQELTELAIKSNYKCIPICSYAVNWFQKNEDYRYLLK